MDDPAPECPSEEGNGVEYASTTAFRANIAAYMDLVSEGLVVCVTYHNKPVAYIVPPSMMEKQ
jgi:prevent-host-death family protein